jgi:hypothetical protein
MLETFKAQNSNVAFIHVECFNAGMGGSHGGRLGRRHGSSHRACLRCEVLWERWRVRCPVAGEWILLMF